MHDSSRPTTISDRHLPPSSPLAGTPASLPPAVPEPDRLPQPKDEPTVSRRSVVSVVVAALIYMYVLSVAGSAEMAPPHAIVFDDARARTFTTPACASARPADAPALSRTTMEAARALGHMPEPECWSNGGFFGRSSSRLNDILEWLRLDRGSGVSRWREDGTWRW